MIDPITHHEHTLDDAMTAYRAAYAAHQAAAATLQEARATADMLCQEFTRAAATSKAALQEAEILLKNCTLATYEATGDKKPAPGLGVREITTYSYDPHEALQWALAHSLALSLDVRAFESLCKSPTTRPDFVTAITAPQVTLGAALKGEA